MITADTITSHAVYRHQRALREAADLMSRLQRQIDEGERTPEEAAETYQEIVTELQEKLSKP